MKYPVSTILSKKDSSVLTISANATVLEAVQEMNRRRVGSILVLDGEKLIGIFTERDVLQRVVAEELPPATTIVSSVMTSEIETLLPSTSIHDAMEAMTERRHRHLPVLDDNGKLCGLISIGDVTRWTSRMNEHEASALRDYISGGFG